MPSFLFFLGSPNHLSEEKADKANKSEDSEGRGESTCSCQPALVHVEPVGFALHQVQELGIHPLTVKIVDRVLKRVLVALLALTLVTTGAETSTKDRDAV